MSYKNNMLLFVLSIALRVVGGKGGPGFLDCIVAHYPLSAPNNVLMATDHLVEWVQFGHLNETLFASTFHVPFAYIKSPISLENRFGLDLGTASSVL